LFNNISKTAKITWFLLVLHWAMDVIYDFYYIHGPMEYKKKPSHHPNPPKGTSFGDSASFKP